MFGYLGILPNWTRPDDSSNFGKISKHSGSQSNCILLTFSYSHNPQNKIAAQEKVMLRK